MTQQTFYRWRSEYGGLRIGQARRLKRLVTGNSRLKRAVAELTLDNQILERGCGRKLLSPSRRRQCVEHLREPVGGLGATSLQGAGPSQVDSAE